MAVRAAPLIERERESEALDRLLANARAGSGGALVIEGPPGIGKSRLLMEARESADDFRVLTARGSDLEQSFPFGIVRQLLEPLLAAADEQQREALLAGAGALAGPVLSQIQTNAAFEPALTALHGLYWFTANAAAQGPLLLLIDDAHWCDGPSLRWLPYVARRADGLRLAMVVTSRSNEPGQVQEAIDELCTLAGASAVRPAQLSEAAVAGMVAQTLPGAEAEFLAACYDATGGNGFLVNELVGELVRREIEPRAANAALVEGLRSVGVDRSVRARLRSLPEECTWLARAVAVLGGRAEPGMAARLSDLDDELAERAADDLAAAAILQSGLPLVFEHPLVRAAVYGELGPGERMQWHGRAAAVQLAAGAEPDRVAVHLLASGPRADPETVDVLRLAARSARQRGAADVAATYLRRALAEPPDATLAAELTLELGSSALAAGDIDTAVENLSGAGSMPVSVTVRAAAAAELGTALTLTDRPADAMRALTEAIQALPESERELGLFLQGTRCFTAASSLDCWRSLPTLPTPFDPAAGPLDSPRARIGLADAALDAAMTGTQQEVRLIALRMLGDDGLIDDPGPDAASFWMVPTVLMLADLLEEAAAIFTDVIAWSRRRGAAPAYSVASHMRAMTWWFRGALAEAEADAANALTEITLRGIPYGALALVDAQIARGQLEEATETWRSAGLDANRGITLGAISHHETKGRLNAARGRAAQALEEYAMCGRLEREWGIVTPAVSDWRSDAVPLLLAAGREQEARDLIDEQLGRCRAFGAPRPLGAALRAASLLHQGDDAIALLEEAVAVLEPSPARLELAYAMLALGSARRRAGHRADARPTLAEALDLALACQADAVALRAHEELIAAGARPRRDPIESRSKLTASESRVARMAAEGMTNREVAQALFVTEKTIENHLRSVFRKLEIGSRTQIGRALTVASS
ncbi:MAG: ATP-binding protein [Gaiellales bacterium]